MYQKRLSAFEIKDHLKVHEMCQEQLCDKRLEETRKNKTSLWTMEELEDVLKQLKNEKSRDPMGFTNELFKSNIAGEDVRKAILKLMNHIKTQLIFQ